MIFQSTYKNQPAVGVKTTAFTALFLPLDGAKLASLVDADGREYMAQAPGIDYRPLTYDGSYVDAECSGFDDMFPTIDPFCRGGVHYPDHGEVCRLPAGCHIDQDTAIFTITSRIFQYTHKKTVRARPDGSMAVEYEIHNAGEKPLPCLWAAHGMLAGEDGAGPVTAYPDGADIRIMFGERGGASFKYYFTARTPTGLCGCHYPKRGTSLMMRYDAKLLPYLGVWISNGGFKDMNCVALEPCTAPYDKPHEDAHVIMPGQEMKFSIVISVERDLS